MFIIIYYIVYNNVNNSIHEVRNVYFIISY